MTELRFFGSTLLLAAAVALGACSRGELPSPRSEAEAQEPVAAKLVHSADRAVGGELLVRFDAAAAERVERAVGAVTRAGGVATRSGLDDFDARLDAIGVRSLHRLFPVDPRHEERTRAAGLHCWYLVSFDEEADLDAAARQLAEVAEVRTVEFNRTVAKASDGRVVPLDERAGAAPASRAGAAFDDPYLARQWHYVNTGDQAVYTGIRAGADVNCAEAWRFTTGDPRVVVAVVDDCVQWDHPDLAANMWVNADERADGADSDGNGYADDVYGYNFVTDGPLTISRKGDAPDHGTHVAGTVAAVNNNGTGVAGVAGGSGAGDGVRIMSCQIFSDGKGGSAAVTARAAKYAADNGAAILQCSFGYDLTNGSPAISSDEAYANGVSVEKQAFDYFISVGNCDALDGGLVIFAAGNDAYALASYPGAYRDYVSVTSMACNYAPAYYTNYGPGCNIAAPGGDLNQGTPAAVLSTLLDGKYGYMQGTSMACPHVSGVAALGLSYALEQGLRFTTDEFKALLLTSVNDINGYCTGSYARYARQMGTGYVDAFRLLMNLRGITCIPVPVGESYTLDPMRYLGDGDLYMTVSGIEISAEDMERLGIASAPTVFANKIVIRCTKPGSAVVGIRLQAGVGNASGMNAMPVTRQFALVVRDGHAGNGGWF